MIGILTLVVVVDIRRGGSGSQYLEPEWSAIDYVEEKGDSLAKKNLPRTMHKQFPNACVTSIMEYVDNKVFGGSANEGKYILGYLQKYKGDVLNNGVSLKNIESFVKDYFETESFENYKTAIKNGNVVMTDIVSPLTGTIHNILILGYQVNGNLIYMDPEEGMLKTMRGSYVGVHYNIVITGNK